MVDRICEKVYRTLNKGSGHVRWVYEQIFAQNYETNATGFIMFVSFHSNKPNRLPNTIIKVFQSFKRFIILKSFLESWFELLQKKCFFFLSTVLQM